MNKENSIDLCELVKCDKQQKIERLKNIINTALKIIEEKRGYYDIPDELEMVLRGDE